MTNPFRLLAVDDNRSLVEALGDVFESRGYTVDTAFDGEQAVERVRNGAYDCILMDIRMPKMSGVDAFKEIRKLSPNTPVILMTAYSVQDLIDEALAEGVFAVIHKPVAIDRILATIEELRGRSPILIVDHQTDPELVASISSRGYRVVVVTSAVHAIEKLATQLYDVVLLSADISGLSSDEAVVMMKELNPKCIIILMSSDPIHETNPLIYASLHKPFKIKQAVDLIERIRSQLNSDVRHP
jgi:two-component system, NtrC family, response regulator HydG